jgi:hypothetical protein
MFAFGLLTDDGFTLVQSGGRVYTYATEEEARSYFNCVRHHAHLYQIDSDLSTARVIELGDFEGILASEIPLTNAHKLKLWTSYKYKSLLAWNPEPEEVQCEGSQT